MKEGEPLDLLHLIFEGEFELSKTVAKVTKTDIDDKTHGADLKEFLPQTDHKLKSRHRNQHFLKSQQHLLKQRFTGEKVSKCRIGLVEPYNLIGISEMI